MGDHNSVVVYTTLFELLYLDIADCYSLDSVTLTRDLETIQGRCTQEGISFLMKTLPSYAKALDRALASCHPVRFVGLTTDERGIPHFLGFLYERVFETFPVEGAPMIIVKNDACVRAIRHLRQLLYYMYKLELPYSKRSIDSVIDTFVETDKELPEMASLDSDSLRILEHARRFATSVFGSFDHRDIVPRHGPGSVATGETLDRKLTFKRIYQTLDAEYPFTEYFMSGLNHVADEPDYISGLQEHPTGQAKVCLVPKDSRGPRLISMEPLELQWIQQGLMRKIVPLLETHKLTRGHVNFTDQTINQRLALEGSKWQQWATLDMKEASDRVSLSLVMEVFSHCPCLAGFLACRSNSTRLPNGTVVELKKFAPMGSALCFPIESFIFYALCVGVLMHVHGMSRREARRSVYVYGDDLIVKTSTVESLTHHLPKFGLMFNLAKCCSSGFFRESCGCDAYKGVDVTPVRLRKQMKVPRAFTAHLGAVVFASTVAQSNQLHERGYYRAAEYLRQWVESYLGPLLILNRDSLSEQSFGGLYWHRPEVSKIVVPDGMKQRFSATHRWEVRSWCVVPHLREKRTNSWRSVLQWFSQPCAEKPTDTYAIRPRIQLKRRWSVIN